MGLTQDTAGEPLAWGDFATLAHELEGPAVAWMLYGSHARGDPTPGSDVDVLQLVSRQRRSYHKGRLSVTVYTAEHLRALAEAGSLFVLHLRTEGKILADEQGALATILASYKAPESYAELERSLRSAARILDVDAPTFARNPHGFIRVGLYLLRTALYIRCAESGRPLFAMAEVMRHRGDPRLWPLFARKDAHGGEQAYFHQVRGLLAEYLGVQAHNEFGTLEALAVNAQLQCPLTASLALKVLGGDTTIDYGHLPAAGEGGAS